MLRLVGGGDFARSPGDAKGLGIGGAGLLELRGEDGIGKEAAAGASLSRAASEVHRLADGIGVDEDGVKDVAHARKDVRGGDEGGANDERGASVGELRGGGEELDREAVCFRVGALFGSQPCDAVEGDVAHVQFLTEGQRGEDDELVGGVVPFHVEAGIGFRVSKGLRVGDGLLHREGAVGIKLREDVVAGAVDDAVDGGDAIGSEARLQRGDDGNAGADAGFVKEQSAVFRGEFVQFAAVRGDEALVCRDEMLPRAERRACNVRGERWFSVGANTFLIIIFTEDQVERMPFEDF